MDKSHGPRMHTYQSSFSGSATANKDGGFGYVGVPTAVKRDFGAGASATEEEFKTNAKQFKRTQLKSKVLKKLAIFGVLIAIVILALGAIGLALNQRYAGRALPYSYIGDISIGGLTEAEIKSALDNRVKNAEITFTEAGLTKTVDPADFSTWFDTEKAAKNAIVGFNPFTYLTPRNFRVPVTVDQNQVDGYLRLYIADKQTPNLDAELIKQGDKLAIKPERYGFRTSSAYVTAELQKQFAEMKDPIVSLSASYERPQITQEDLKDDLENANAMVSTDIGLKVWNTKISPSIEDKITWLDINKIEGTNDVIIEFNQAKVREYIFGLADKYSYEKEDEMIAVTENGSQYIKGGKNGQKVKNIDKIASDFYTALTTKQSGLFAFEFDYVEYAKIDRQSVNLITVADEEDDEAIEEAPADEQTVPSEDEIVDEDQVSINPAGNPSGNRRSN